MNIRALGWIIKLSLYKQLMTHAERIRYITKNPTLSQAPTVFRFKILSSFSFRVVALNGLTMYPLTPA